MKSYTWGHITAISTDDVDRSGRLVSSWVYMTVQLNIGQCIRWSCEPREHDFKVGDPVKVTVEVEHAPHGVA